MSNQQTKRRKKRYQPGSAYAGDVKPQGVFSAFANVRLFFIIGVAVMVGGVVLGAVCSLGSTQSSNPDGTDDFVKPQDSEATGTPGGSNATVKQYTAAPALTIDASKTYTATITTAEGDIQLELLASEVPETVNNFVFLARDGFYDGLIFHQVTPDFVAQAGDPNCQAGAEGSSCAGRGGPGYDWTQEKPGEFTAGTIGMANGSQFFIAMTESQQFEEYTPFARITSGADVADRLTQGTEITAIVIAES